MAGSRNLWGLSLSSLSLRAQDSEDLQSLEEQAILRAVDRVAPSVLQIETVGGLDRAGEMAANLGPSTALVVDAEGYLLSSAINFVQQPASVFARLPNGERLACQVVARDHSRHLVLLKIDPPQPLAVPRWVERREMRVGSWAIAVGRALSHTEPGISAGILSATDRIWGKAIQTDAKISLNNFGGPLVNIRGEVLGILTPLSPTQDTDLAGADWYDSGIGFAVPISELLDAIESMKQGVDQYPGRMGATFEGKNVYADPAKIAALVGTSPAAAAGMRPGDEIVQLEGQDVQRQSQLKHLLGPRYAGEEVAVVVDRQGQRLEFNVTLAREIDAFVQPWLGVLVSDTAEGLQVRNVFADSPAMRAGIRVGDRLSGVGQEPVADIEALRLKLIGLSLETPTQLQWLRGEAAEPVAAEISLDQMKADVPEQVQWPQPQQEGNEPNWLTIRVPEMANLCHALVPANRFGRPAGLMVWVPEPGQLPSAAGDEEQAEQAFREFAEPWLEICERANLILLVPRPGDARRWQNDEAEFVQKAVDQLQAGVQIDAERVAIGGRQAGGAMAAVVAFRYRDLFRGLILEDASIPSSVGRLAADPVNRLQVLSVNSPKAESEATAGEPSENETTEDPDPLEALHKARIPAVWVPVNGDRDVAAAEYQQSLLELLARWHYCLDRL